MDENGSASGPATPAEAELPVPSVERAGLTRGQGIAIIILLCAVLTVGLVVVVLLVRRAGARNRRRSITEYLGGRAHALVHLGEKELDDLLSKKQALRLETWEPKVGELLKAPRALAARL